MATWTVQYGIGEFKDIEADEYAKDGDWFHFFDAAGDKVASFMAISVEKKA